MFYFSREIDMRKKSRDNRLQQHASIDTVIIIITINVIGRLSKVLRQLTYEYHVVCHKFQPFSAVTSLAVWLVLAMLIA